jgi:hypothetical protein
MAHILSQLFLTTIPSAPPIADIPLVDGVTLVNEIRQLIKTKQHLAIASGTFIEPRAIIKHEANGRTEYRSTVGFEQSHQTYEAAKLLSHDWPKRYDPFIGKYLWLNSYGDTIAPVWEGRANLLGEPLWVVFGLLSMWAHDKAEYYKGVVWLQAGPQVFMARHLPLFLLSILPDMMYNEVLDTFPSLGQDFFRYLVSNFNQTTEATKEVTLPKLLPKIGTSFVVKGTHQVLVTLKKERDGQNE